MKNKIDETTKIKSQLESARATLAATGKSPRELGHEAKMKVLAWIYFWGFSTSNIIQLLLRRSSGGYAQKLVKQGWLTSTKTQSGTPKVFFTLSIPALAEVERHSTKLYRYPEIDQFKVNQKQIRHYVLAQQATLYALNANAISSYETERMFDEGGDKLNVKRPDVVWQKKNNQSQIRIGVEMELTAKWERHLDDFVLGIAKALHSTNELNAKFDRFIICSDSAAIILRYRTAMQPGSALNIWKKNQRGHWIVDKTIQVPDWLIKKIDFQLIGDKQCL